MSGRSQSYYCQKVLSKTLDDGHSWRKYGQKDIQSAKYPRYVRTYIQFSNCLMEPTYYNLILYIYKYTTCCRSYFRCTHKTHQGCKAMRQVQVSEEDPSRYVITYLGEHTCRDPPPPPLVPQIISSGSGQSISFGIVDCSENFKIAEAVVPQPSPVPALNHEHCDGEVRSHLRFPFENDGATASMEVYFMDEFEAYFHNS